MRFVALALIVFHTAGVATTTMKPFVAGEPLPVALEEAPRLFKQCSRRSPSPTAILGSPTAQEIDALEMRVFRYVAELYDAWKPTPPDLTFSRQYVAYSEGGKRKIYANFFPPNAAKSLKPGRALVVCDGGSQFWGIVYDPERELVEQLEMNGPKQ